MQGLCDGGSCLGVRGLEIPEPSIGNLLIWEREGVRAGLREHVVCEASAGPRSTVRPCDGHCPRCHIKSCLFCLNVKQLLDQNWILMAWQDNSTGIHIEVNVEPLLGYCTEMIGLS